MPRRIVGAKRSQSRTVCNLAAFVQNGGSVGRKGWVRSLRARKVSVIFIPAAESLPCQGNGKLEERFRALLQYRKELRIPETNRPIVNV